ncbi:MAG: hypothetical protein HKN04_07700, partial [Rhodothermaceae bacterium]|nr:hypothetical protein [Rhodothermaceae bacterium]
MVETANDFAEGEDRRVIYAMEQIMAEALSDELQPLLAAAVEAHRAGTIVPSDTTAFDEPVVGVDTLQATLDALVGDLVSGSLLASLADYFVRLDLVGPESDTLASYVDPVPEEREPVSPRAGKADPLNVDTLRVRAAERDADGIYLRRAPVERRRGTYRYAGIGPIAADSIPVAWVYVQAVPRLQRYVAETPFPRVLVPAGLFGEDDEDFSYAEYDNGVLVRSRGDVSGPSRLTSAVRRVFVDDAPAAWVRERIGDQTYRSYYRRLPVSKGGRLDVVAVRSVAAA